MRDLLIRSYFENGKRKFKQLARAQIFFANLDQVDTQMHLIANYFEQRAKAAHGFAVRNVVPLHFPTKYTAADGISTLRRSLPRQSAYSASLISAITACSS